MTFDEPQQYNDKKNNNVDWVQYRNIDWVGLWMMDIAEHIEYNCTYYCEYCYHGFNDVKFSIILC